MVSQRHRFLITTLAAILAAMSSGPVFAADGTPATPLRHLADASGSTGGAPVPSGALDQLRLNAAETAGAIFVDEDKVMVKPPVLQALITLNHDLSPYALESMNGRTIGLPDVLQAALGENFDIRIANTDTQTARWKHIAAMGGFLPDLINGVNYQYLDGKYASPFGLLTGIRSPYWSMPTGLQWNFFKGGSIIYTAKQTKHEFNAARAHQQGETNDILLDATDHYYNLVLNDILLQIRVKAVETSKALLLRNEVQYENGANTKLDVLEARSQLSRDRQALISQQVARREAAVRLARLLNLDPTMDLSTVDRMITKMRLVDENLKIGDLVQIAVDNRPELKKYEQLRLAAKDAIRVAFSTLLPQVYGTAGAIGTGAKVVGGSLGGASSAGGGPLTGGAFSTSSSSSVSVNGNKTKRFNMAELFEIGMTLQWNLGGLGLTEAAAVQQAKWQARKAQLDFSKRLAWVYQEVHDSYLDVLEAENLITETTDAVNAAREELDVASTRLEESVGTDMEVVNAQREFTDALINKANAIIKFNTAQAKLLRSIGKISTPTLLATRPLSR